MKLIKFLQVASAAFFFAGSAFAQTSGTVSNHAIAVGKGPGQFGFTSVSCADKLFLSGVAGLDPACRALVGADLPFPGVSSLGGVKSLAAASNQFLTGLGTDGALTRAQPAFSNLSGSATCAQLPALTGDVTTSAGSCGTAIGAGKVTNTMLAAMTSAQLAAIISDETGTGALVFANSPVLTTPNLGTPSAATLTNATGLPVATGISGLATGIASFLQTPSSANLAAAVTNETGSGALVFGTSPNITTPTGIVKGDVGLGNVANVDQTNATNIISGTLNAARLPSPFTSGTASGNTSKFATTTGALTSGNCAKWDASGNIVDAGAACGTGGGGGSSTNVPPQGRITLVSGLPVMATSQAGKTIVYYTPYGGNVVPISNGTNMVPTAISELSQATTDTTKSPSAVSASSVYDLFVWDDSGTPRCTRGPPWTNSTTRGYSFAVVDGIVVNASAITNGPAANRGTWVGTIASNASGTIDWIMGGAGSGGVAGVLNVWNAYNRVDVSVDTADTGTQYTYTTATVRQARASASNQISWVSGAAEDGSRASMYGFVNTTGTGAIVRTGIGLDSTTTFARNQFLASYAGISLSQLTVLFIPPQLGSHRVTMLEMGDGTNANTFNVGGGNVLSFQLKM